MTITITTSGKVTKPRKPRATRTKASRAKESRTFPKWREGMTTMDYVNAYHAANATVNLTTVSYTCQ